MGCFWSGNNNCLLIFPASPSCLFWLLGFEDAFLLDVKFTHPCTVKRDQLYVAGKALFGECSQCLVGPGRTLQRGVVRSRETTNIAEIFVGFQWLL